jgi:hypothetical protein
MHVLHTRNSPFAGMLMFMEPKVMQVKMEANVSHPSWCGLDDFHPPCRVDWSLQIKAQYNSYIAVHEISVYSPVSVMSALKESGIKNFWVATGLPTTIILLINLAAL